MFENLNICLYRSIREEAECICNQILNLTKNSIKSAILINNQNSRFYSAIRAELKYRKIMFQDFIKPQYSTKDSFLLEIMVHWADWQYNRDIFSFLKFCNNLVAVELLNERKFQNLNKILNHLMRSYLTENFDVLFKKLNLKNDCDYVKEYDLGTDFLTIDEFLIKYEKIFKDFLNDDHIQYIKKIFQVYDRNIKIDPKILINVLFCTIFDKNSTDFITDNFKTSSVCLISSKVAIKWKFEHIFYSCTDHIANEINDQYIEYVLRKNFSTVSCSLLEDNFPDFLQNIFYKKYRFEITYDNVEKLLIHSPNEFEFNFLDESIFQTKIAYNSRRNQEMPFDEYSYMLDALNINHIPCKIIELLFKNPSKIFYEYILHLENIFAKLAPKVLKKIFIGSIVHELLNISNKCSEIPQLEQYYSHINKKFNYIQADILATYKSANIEPNIYVLEALNSSKYLAYKFAKKIVESEYRYIATEVDIPQRSSLKVNEQSVILSGRVDCILTHEPFSTTVPSEVTLNIFDFKTGIYELLNNNSLFKQLSTYVGIQAYMYGLAFKNFGFRNINVQIIRPEHDITSPINIDSFLSESENFFLELCIILKTGIIGERERSFITEDIFFPLATSIVDNSIITSKRKNTLSKK